MLKECRLFWLIYLESMVNCAATLYVKSLIFTLYKKATDEQDSILTGS